MVTSAILANERGVQKALGFLNSKDYQRRVRFKLQKPDCPPYDGGWLCGYWGGWIFSNRGLHPDTPAGRKAYIEELKKIEPRLKLKDIRRVLNEIDESPIARELVFN
jgi:hypothetical protein